MSDTDGWIIDIEEERGKGLRHSRRLDVHRWSDYSEVNTFVDQIYEQYFSGGNQQIRKKHVKVILLDLYVAWCGDPTLKISYSRSPNNYLAGSIYNELHISRTTISVIDHLEKVGLVEQAIGFFNKEIKSGFDTRMWPTPALIEIFSGARFSPLDVSDHQSRRAIELKDSEGIKIEYEQTEETERMGAFLGRYNSLLRRSFISIPHLEDMRIQYGSPDSTSPKYLQVSQNDKFVQRKFNRSSFECGGRFYGGWWQRCPKEWRRHILINDHTTNEIDFSGLHPVMLYALAGINYWQDIGGDPYDIGDLSFLSDTEHCRALAKKMMFLLVNAPSLRSSFAAFRDKAIKGSFEKRLTNSQLNEVATALMNKHSPIADNLHSDVGIHLQYLDSKIAEKILTRFTEWDVPVLAIHDSFIVSSANEEIIANTMVEAFSEEMNLHCHPEVTHANITYEELMGRHYNTQYQYMTEEQLEIEATIDREIQLGWLPERSERYLREWEQFQQWTDTQNRNV